MDRLTQRFYAAMAKAREQRDAAYQMADQRAVAAKRAADTRYEQKTYAIQDRNREDYRKSKRGQG